MRLNVSTCYAMQIMLYLTRNRKSVSSSELSNKLMISQRYILQIAGKLRDGKLLGVKAGMSGGYSLNMQPSAISVYDVISLMEGDIGIPECVTNIPGCGEPCKTSNLLDTLSVMKDYLDTYLKSITFDSLADMNISGHLPDILGLVVTHIDEMKAKS